MKNRSDPTEKFQDLLYLEKGSRQYTELLKEWQEFIREPVLSFEKYLKLLAIWEVLLPKEAAYYPGFTSKFIPNTIRFHTEASPAELERIVKKAGYTRDSGDETIRFFRQRKKSSLPATLYSKEAHKSIAKRVAIHENKLASTDIEGVFYYAGLRSLGVLENPEEILNIESAFYMRARNGRSQKENKLPQIAGITREILEGLLEGKVRAIYETRYNGGNGFAVSNFSEIRSD